MVVLANVISLNEFLETFKNKSPIGGASTAMLNRVRYKIAMILHKISPIISQYQKDRMNLIEAMKNDHKFIEDENGEPKIFDNGNYKIKEEYLKEYQEGLVTLLSTEVDNPIKDVNISPECLSDVYDIDIDQWEILIPFIEDM